MTSNLSDRLYAYRELRATSKSIDKEFQCLSSFIKAVFIEAILLSKGISMMVSARGGIPKSIDWQVSLPAGRRLGLISYRVIGDALLIAVFVIILSLRDELWRLISNA